MLARLAYRLLTEVSPRLLVKAATLWVGKGSRALRAWRRRRARGELFPPFLFLSLTSACNLRCRGCWIDTRGPVRQLSLDDVEGIIAAGRRHDVSFYTLLGGEPMVYPHLWQILDCHPDCYFQIITNGMFLTDEACRRFRALGNVTPLVSIDGLEAANDQRRGRGVYQAVIEGLRRLKSHKLLYGVATTVTGANFDEVLDRRYVRQWIELGAMYLWYYVFRPVGADPAPELCVSRDRMIELRRRLLQLRRTEPIIVIDTYWDADGKAVCPAALGLGYHVGPGGHIEPCPPLSFARETVRDHQRDLGTTINRSALLREFQSFVAQRTRGCVILECPDELLAFLRSMGAEDTSGRDAYAELAAAQPRTSHHLPGEELPEDSRFYRFLKHRLFFGLGGYG